MNLSFSSADGRQTASQAGKRAATAGTVDLTVVVPTFNEAGNVPLLVDRLAAALAGVAWEVIFVDDDLPDGTADVVREIAGRDRRVRVIRRLGRRGLSTACVEGVMASSAPYFPRSWTAICSTTTRSSGEMLRMLKEQRLDIVIGSRYADGERTQGLSEWRQRVSRLGGQIARLVLKADLTDPMSGFFVMSRAAFDAEVHALSQRGFKILLDIFASAPRLLRYAEVPCRFNRRQSGESKLDTMVAWEFGVLVLDKLVGHFVPVRFVIFAAVGLTGVAVHLATLGSMALVGSSLGGAVGRRVRRDDLEFHPQQPDHLPRPAAARFGILPRAAQFLRHRRHRRARQYRGHRRAVPGRQRLVGGGLAGGLIGVVWNFTMSSMFTWRRGSFF